MFVRKLALSVVLIVFSLVGAAFGHAQTTSGALVGVIRDASGAVVPNSTVNATNEATGVVYTGKSNASGDYRISNLPEGTYDLRTAVPGFMPSLLKGVVVAATSVETQDIVLSVGQNTTTVEVTTQASVSIDTTTAQIGTTFSTKETQDLPSATIGLGVLNLSLLTPGVTSSGGLGAGTGPSIAGQRPRNNNFTIDGIDNNNKGVTGPLLNVPNDAISEFVLLQNVYPAQYGHSTGGQFNSLIVSGANQIHGRLYEYFKNRNLNAVSSTQAINNRAQGISPDFQPRFDFNRYGGQVGGPILKDKLFLFSNFERQTTGSAGASTAFCAPTAAGFATMNGLTFASPSNYSVYKTYVPAAPNQAPAGGGTSCNDSKAVPGGATILVANAAGVSTPVPVGAVSLALSNSFNSYFSTNALDYTISQHDNLRVRYVYNRADTNDTAASFPAFFAPAPSRFHLISANEVHTFTPSLSNEFRLGYNRFFTEAVLPAINFPGLAQFPNLIFYDFSTTTYLGPDASAPQSDIQNLYQAIDSLTWIKGKHTLVFGMEGRKYIAPTVFVQRLRGDYEYSTLGRYLNDISPDEVGQRNATPPGVSPTFYGDQSSIYAYANDDYRMTQKLTLNLGLRYEFTSVPASEKEQALNIAASVPGLITFGKPTPQYKNFAPRIGVAYAPDENTAVHAAFGINYDVLYDNIGTTTAPPQFQTTENVDINTAKPGFLAGGGLPANATFATLAQQRAATSAFVPNQKLPYSEQWTVGVQHVFHRDYTAEVRYVGTHGIHLDVQEQISVQSPVTAANQLPTNLTGGAVTFNPANTLAALKAPVNGFPSYLVQAYAQAGLTASSITSDEPFGGSHYNGLQTQLTRRFQNGLLVNASYTYSRAFDDSTADFNTTALNPRRPQDSQDLHAEFSRSDLDRPHRLTLVGVYDLPFFKNSNFLMKNVVGNWEIAPSYTFQSPQYTTVQSTVDSNLNNDSAGDRVFINPNGIKGTGTGVVPLVNTAVTCPTSTTGTKTYGVANGTSAVVVSCAANTIGYTAGSLSGPSAAQVFTASNAYYVQGGPGTNPTAPRNTLPTGRTNNLDLSIFKRVSFMERYRIEFGAQAVNLLNHSQYFPGSLDTVNSIGSTGSRNFDTVTNTQFNQKQLVFSNNPRNLQLSGKIIF
ncbi:MAG TPA: TonB-dependent receptor [Edaphobacter sp.]|nr:TonB-dependent receptor [Edaphobacter sp.]